MVARVIMDPERDELETITLHDRRALKVSHPEADRNSPTD
jgi:hypothetical protein